MVSPLTDLLSNKTPFVWSPQCQTAFCAVKNLLCSAPVLAAPVFDKPFEIQVDASDAGAVLLQEGNGGVRHPVCFFSRKFNRHQLNYSVVEKETLALIWALKNFEVYVGTSGPVTVYTDHNLLTFLTGMQNANHRLMRWVLFLQPYTFNVKHIKGRENVLADALSRAPC